MPLDPRTTDRRHRASSPGADRAGAERLSATAGRRPGECGRHEPAGGRLHPASTVGRSGGPAIRRVAAQPAHIAALDNLGVLLARQGRYAEAIQHFRQAVARDSKNPQTQLNLGNALASNGEVAEAIAVLARAAELAPDQLRPARRPGQAAGATEPPGPSRPVLAAHGTATTARIRSRNSSWPRRSPKCGQVSEAIAAYHNTAAQA